MMLSRTLSYSLLLAVCLIAACQPVPNAQLLPSLTPIPQEISTPEAKELFLTEFPTDEPLSTPEPSEEPTLLTPSETAADEIINNLSEEVLITVGDLDMAGTFYFPQDYSAPWPGVILIHMLYGDRSQWETFPDQLTEAGFAVLSIDLRGHGATGGSVNWDLAITDLQQVWSMFAARQDIDQDRTAIIGASIGANLALISSSNEASIRTAVLLSPGLNYAGVETGEAMKSYSDRPVLIVASQEDAYAANSSTTLEDNALGVSQLIMYQNAGHGTFMFRSEPELSQVITDWLDLYLE